MLKSTKTLLSNLKHDNWMVKFWRVNVDLVIRLNYSILFKTKFPYNKPVKELADEIKQKVKNNKKLKFKIALVTDITTSIISYIFNSNISKLLNKYYKPLELKFVNTSDFKYTGSCLDFLKDEYKGKSVLIELTNTLNSVIFEEAAKQATLEMGCIKEYLIIFIGSENILASYAPILVKLMDVIAKHEDAIVKMLKPFGINPKTVKYEISRLKINPEYVTHVTKQIGQHKYKISLNRTILDRWILGTLDHIIYAVLHKLGFHNIAILYHFIWNALLSNFYLCIKAKKIGH